MNFPAFIFGVPNFDAIRKEAKYRDLDLSTFCCGIIHKYPNWRPTAVNQVLGNNNSRPTGWMGLDPDIPKQSCQLLLESALRKALRGLLSRQTTTILSEMAFSDVLTHCGEYDLHVKASIHSEKYRERSLSSPTEAF